MPALHWAITSWGLLMMKSGLPITGRRKEEKMAGKGMSELSPNEKWLPEEPFSH
jgi:hypothetical protein